MHLYFCILSRVTPHASVSPNQPEDGGGSTSGEKYRSGNICVFKWHSVSRRVFAAAVAQCVCVCVCVCVCDRQRKGSGDAVLIQQRKNSRDGGSTHAVTFLADQDPTVEMLICSERKDARGSTEKPWPTKTKQKNWTATIHVWVLCGAVYCPQAYTS